MTISNSPFQPPLQGGAPLPTSSSKLIDDWQSEADFCKSFGGAPNDQSVCFSGNSVSFNTTPPSPSPKGICLERIGNGSYLNMAPHPDGSNRIFLGSQPGKIWLATVPDQGSGGILQFDETSPFADLTDQVHFDSQFGLMGMAFHPNFATNGRFFASYNCDRTKSPSCSGRCSCNSDVGCDPSKVGTDNGAQPCQYQVVVSEYSAKGSSANISEVCSSGHPPRFMSGYSSYSIHAHSSVFTFVRLRLLIHPKSQGYLPWGCLIRLSMEVRSSLGLLTDISTS